MLNHKMNRRIFLLLILLLLISLSYLALEISIYYEGGWQLVQGQEGFLTPNEKSPFIVKLPSKQVYDEDEWDVLRNGKLFFKLLPVQQNNNQQITDTNPGLIIELPKPVCLWNVVGVLLGNEAKAIMEHKENHISQTVTVGSKLEEFEVIEIKKESVLVKSSEAEFRLELGGM
ncbi:MAG: hypothetical protein KAX49_02075 [Halanaerobiales bacterium]|nr:hypothetical protein [Halanaerobiales bacterium]